MKILTITATPFFSDRGCHMRIYNEAKFLQKFGAEVKICAYHYGKDIDGFDIERIEKSNWYKRTNPGFSWGKFWLDIKLIFLCRRIIRSFRPDIIHAHLYEGLGIGYIAKKIAFRNVPIVFDLQGDLEEEFRNYNQKNYIARRIFVWLSKIFISRCDWLILSNEKMMLKIEKVFPHKDRIFVIKDGVDVDLFREIPELAEKERKKIEDIKNWKAGRKLLVYIGGLSDNKGVGELIKSFGDWAVDGSGEWKLLIGGFGVDEEKYRKFIEENNLKNSIYFSGKVEYFSLPSFMGLANAAIDPKNSSFESSGKLVNLMATKLPIICFENDFNRARLGEKGYYMQSFGDFGSILAKINGREKIDYDVKDISQGGEVRKLMSIFRLLTK
jgi:glycosyltransferase involved in cell wall biosynthesis